MSDALSRRDFILLAAASTMSAEASQKLDAGVLGNAAASGVLSAPEGVIQAVDYANVRITDKFWHSKMELVATVSLNACITQTELKSGRIRNFEKAALRHGDHEGIFYDDSDVYKAIEAIAYSLENFPNAALEAKADDWISKIAAAQLPDGYLNTYYTLTGLEHRWTDMSKHEDYCAGHLIEAAIAYYNTTGKHQLLDVAIRFADHLDTTFRQANRHWVSGHEEIELALMKLFALTHESRYADLAEWYVEQRGHGYGKGEIWNNGLGPDYCQDGLPVEEQRHITGHAVRAMYLYSGVADIAASKGIARYSKAMEAVWQDVVQRKMYLTGGIGSSGQNEGFTNDYDLPNEQAYCETCASVGMVFWNQRMAMLTGDSQYIDVLERSLYNGALDGLSLTGDHFFYGNPLAAKLPNEGTTRSEWFGTACCPSNIARLVSSIGKYFYASAEHDIWVNLYGTSGASIRLSRTSVMIDVSTQYPWNGEIRVVVDPAQPCSFRLRLRIPGWAKGQATPGDLYRFASERVMPVEIRVNRKPVSYRVEKGYAVIERSWKKGDLVEYELPMPVRYVFARDEVSADKGLIALQRGPIVYCVEGAGNSGTVWNYLFSPQPESITVAYQKILNEPIVALEISGSVLIAIDAGKRVEREPKTVTAIPYYTWANRGKCDMRVWLPTKVTSLVIES